MIFNKIKNKKIFIFFSIIGFSVLYVSFLIKQKPQNNISLKYDFLEKEIKNDFISISVNLKGAIINKIFLKKYNYVFLNNSSEIQENCFETGWLSADKDVKLPNRFTLWQIEKYTSNEIILYTIINNYKFKKFIKIIDYKVEIKDSFESKINLYNFSIFSLKKNKNNNLNFISYKDNNKIIRIANETINKKQKISKKKILGLEKKFFLCFCKINNEINGDILIQNKSEENENQIFYISDENSNKEVSYTLYVLPKERSILNKYQLENMMDYGFFSFIVKYLNILLEFFIKKTSNSILSLLLISLIILFCNIFCIYFFEKERIKILNNLEEKKYIENNSSNLNIDQDMKLYYQKHKIKIFRILFLPIIFYFFWFILFKTTNINFLLYKKKFLWIHDLSSRDPVSILDFLHLSSIPIFSFISSDLLSIISLICFISSNKYFSISHQKSNKFMEITQIFLTLSMCKNVNTAFLLCFIFICCSNYIVSKIFLFFFYKNKKHLL